MENNNHPMSKDAEPGTRRLFVRFGDAGEYEAFGSVEDLRAAMHERKVFGPYEACNLYGITAKDFTGNNYISVYWATDTAHMPESGLTDEELAFLNEYESNEPFQNADAEAERFLDGKPDKGL